MIHEDLLLLMTQLVEAGITLELSYDSTGYVVKFVDGFYKSDGSAILFVESDTVKLRSRYDAIATITSLEDIVLESHEWYEYSMDRFSGWANPHPHWKPLYDLYIT